MKIAMIGLGDIAQKAYLPVLAQWPDIELVLCTRSPIVLKTLATRYRVSATCTDYRDVLQHGVDAVMIHAATDVHSTLAAFFLRLGIPTFVDKPLAASAQECEILYELAEKYHQPLYVGFNRRHIPLYNQHLSELAQQECGALRSLRWEKHRHALPGDIRTFVFDDFIHPLDSVNLSRQCNLDDLHLTYHMSEGLLARLDVQWQTGDTLLHASMNRQFGITTEHVTASYDNVAYLFDSFTQGKMWRDNQESRVALKDWTPMLSSKGFEAMVQDWLQVAAAGRLPTHIIERNLASHQLAEAICQQITQQVTKG
ncbi:Gfo/Idh/MocA family oxidoreductase [Vibrio cholerae]|uniref:Gfo/Idh/MocA family protein n=1 Tax=Vibrio TaxID=662 RepID=UPI0002C15FF4|nr:MULTISPECIES: Gfo/Idh/MocA family oxidoreductase [Vibrio]EGR0287057.1 Gfo/Idh/MocA family oxidoreductase [Vibrio cholerae]EKF9088416.1 Gfo/Idh/MocA family oxidoreductase [Vibrio cholerae]EMA2408536.1 Gfo/Idh/MocA family oxidoreductase [Vibrio cholerae]EMP92833.1 oxidoreductase, Gfo/Idh/MocA family [Vibrio paracholerae 87395]MEB5596611.1 gfo/Idh/MocA family oxidoreductase [Vibrio cholerae]